MFMKNFRLVASACLVLGVAAACERSSQEYAGVKAASGGQPAYDVAPKSATREDVALVRAVLPQGDEGVDGAALFAKSCAACHQITGQGVPGAFPPLDGSPYVVGDNVDRLATIMLYGLIGPIHVKGVLYNNVMTPWGPLLKDEELAAIATYIRSSWSNKAGPVSADVFTRARQKWGTHPQFQISELGEEN